MNIIELKGREELLNDSKLKNSYNQLEKYLQELRKKEIPSSVTEIINQHIEQLNNSSVSDKEFRKEIKNKQNKVLHLVEKKLKIVPKNYYRNLWMVLGMSTFGLPFGVLFGLSIGNIALLGIGLPIGMAIGIGVGTSMDKKAFEEGRQLDIEIKN